jgi:hypothetical protein
MDNEDFVRLHWVKPQKHWTDNDSYGPDIFTVELEDYSFADANYDKVWERAAIFTKARLQKVKETKEEIDWLSNSELIEVVDRLLSEALGRFIALTKGLKSDA